MYKDTKFSLWCDFIERDFINAGFKDLISKGVINGATSNPAIFKSAFLTSQAYKETITRYSKKKSPKELYEILATQDIKTAAYKLLTNYANGDDGFISIEVDPELFDDSVMSVKEGKKLFNAIKMPNVMIKLPACERGYLAMSELVKKGINVNATLVFSTEQVKCCLDAFEKGLKGYKKRYPNAPQPECVISVFVSRFDRALNEKLKAASIECDKYGIYNATLAYYQVEERGLKNVRALFASTGVKEGKLAKDYYIDELLFAHSVNTAPLDAIKAFEARDHKAKKPVDKASIEKFFDACQKAGVKYDQVCKELFSDGIRSFKEAFKEIMDALATPNIKASKSDQEAKEQKPSTDKKDAKAAKSSKKSK